MHEKREITPQIIVHLLVNSALVAKIMAGYRDAETRLARAESLSRAWGQRELEDYALSEKAGLYYQWGRYEEGLALADRLISKGKLASERYLAAALNTSGNINLRRCEFREAESCFLRAMEYFRRLNMEISLGTANNNLANIHNIQGNYPRAMELYGQALECFERQHDIFRTAHVLYSMAQIELARKNQAKAKALLQRSLGLRQQVQDYRGITNTLLMQIGILAEESDFEGARRLLTQADRVISEHQLTDPHLRAYRDGEAGMLHFAVGEYDEAERCLLRLIELSQRMKEMSFTARGYCWLGKTKVFRDGTGAGIEDINRGIEMAESGDLPLELKDGWNYMTECYSRLGRPGEARKAAESFARLALEQGDDRAAVEAEVARLLSVKS